MAATVSSKLEGGPYALGAHDDRGFARAIRKVARNRLAVVGAIVLASFYTSAVFAEFVAPHPPDERRIDGRLAPPQQVRLLDNEGRFTSPFVYAWSWSTDPFSGQRTWVEDTDQPLPLQLFARGTPYRLFGVIPLTRRLVGVEDGLWYPFGGDAQGRDVFSRIVFGARISLSIGLLGATLTVLFGTLLGLISGYYGGHVDNAIQRLIELLAGFPTIPLWMALAAAIPPAWSPAVEFLLISLILSLLSWGGLARQLRGLVLSLREGEFVVAATAIGASDGRVMIKHVLPNLAGYITVSLTLAIPLMIIAETSLSFLGLGLRPPANSWGVLLTTAQNIQSIADYPWLLIPGIFVVLTVLSFNFVGDALRDALDPRKV